MNKYEDDQRSDRICQQCGVALEKHRNIATGKTIWTCPGDKCSYKENSEGEMI